MTVTGTTLVIGATGTTGSRTAARLVAAGHRVKAGSRRASATLPGTEPVRFDWYEPATFGDALAGVDRLYLVPPVGDPDPVAVMAPFLRQARDGGVHRAVLLSSSAVPEGGPAVGAVHRALPGLFDHWAVLRPSWFMQNFTGTHVHADSIRDDGVILTATGSGRIGFVDADDIAAVAAHALTDDRAPNTDLVLTGPEALGHDDIARILSEVTGRPVAHRRLTHDGLRDRLAPLMPPEFATMLADMDRAIADGAEDRTTDTVRRITGRPPHGFRQVAERELAHGG
ncbi:MULTISPECIES: NmrA family NAD(P)-binding protein [unclassified Streptomyces]|uniref:NmrA family NAD(P)-binding protein n=1 Tax=unclassified Streptomyces TaxID=2593676 RepID=UPI002252C530|nr:MULTISPECIES: NmrA family NAD(P)-binding protein [unclassified Streptomyces]MCX4528533.1 NmrA family NAD(P)-binding protein [Streptomyces sp. NBC_01551]MCX4540869.1 NmrA family NAD(P)-binding protein [Streptomyces sp. NBC_01565]